MLYRVMFSHAAVIRADDPVEAQARANDLDHRALEAMGDGVTVVGAVSQEPKVREQLIPRYTPMGVEAYAVAAAEARL